MRVTCVMSIFTSFFSRRPHQRVDWKQERKLNRETFGVVAARRPTFFRNNQHRPGGFGGTYNQHRGYHQQRGSSGYQGGYRNSQNRNGPRTPSSSNNVSSTTTDGGSPSNALTKQRTFVKNNESSATNGTVSSSGNAGGILVKN